MFILKFIIKLFLKILDRIAKLIVFVIIKLFLWIPMIFAGIFALASAVVPFPFMQYFLHFTIITSSGVVLALLLSFYKYFIHPAKKREKLRAKNNLSNVSKKVRTKESKNIKDDRESIQTQKEEYQSEEIYDNRVFDTYVGPKDILSDKPKRNTPWFNAVYEVKPEPTASLNIPDLNSYQKFDTDHIIREGEEVKLFRTRKDPSLYIAQFPDRIEYYRKTADKMVLVSVEENNIFKQ